MTESTSELNVEIGTGLKEGSLCRRLSYCNVTELRFKNPQFSLWLSGALGVNNERYTYSHCSCIYHHIIVRLQRQCFSNSNGKCCGRFWVGSCRPMRTAIKHNNACQRYGIIRSVTCSRSRLVRIDLSATSC